MENDRVLLVRRGCEFCNMSIRVVNKINLKLPMEKQIRIIDCYEWDEFGVALEPIMEILSKSGFDSYPFFYMNGKVIKRAPTQKVLKVFLTKLLEDEFII